MDKSKLKAGGINYLLIERVAKLDFRGLCLQGWKGCSGQLCKQCPTVGTCRETVE